MWATGPEGAAKVTVMLDEEPSAWTMAALEGSASSLYRRVYQEWPKPWEGQRTFGRKITPPKAA